MTSQVCEMTVQVLVEMEDGSEVPHHTKNYVVGKIQNMFPKDTHSIRSIITVAGDDEIVISAKYENNPTTTLRERAWT